jgi:hypothetical protein
LLTNGTNYTKQKDKGIKILNIKNVSKISALAVTTQEFEKEGVHLT